MCYIQYLQMDAHMHRYGLKSHTVRRYLEKHKHGNVCIQVHAGSDYLSARIIIASSLQCDDEKNCERRTNDENVKKPEGEDKG